MSEPLKTTLARLLESAIGYERRKALYEAVEVPQGPLSSEGESVSRAVLAMAMDLMLFEDILRRVPDARAYVMDQVRNGRKVVYDHGALRTVKTSAGPLPSGYLAFARILEPLGYRVNGVYPLDRLAMTGRAYAHEDLPEILPQFFVSELHPERFSPPFQEAVGRVLSTTRDPLPGWVSPMLDELAEMKELPFPSAQKLLPALVGAFDRHHEPPALSDYKLFLAESAEMAWISTEGNAFNHATDRVADVVTVAEAQKALGRAMKDEVEVSTSGRVIQTAYRAASVEREFVDGAGVRVVRTVPGSFFEFITRKEETAGRLDLRFDAGNAQAIFKMTATEWC
jgi:hypothetical protein